MILYADEAMEKCMQVLFVSSIKRECPIEVKVWPFQL